MPTWGFNQRYWPGLYLTEVPGCFLHLKPTAGCQISTLIFDLSFGGILYKYSMKNILRTTNSLPTWGVDQRYCAGLYLTEVPEWVSAPQSHSRVSNINFDFWIFFCGGGSLWISHDKYIKDGKVHIHLGFQSKILVGPLTDWSAWVGFCTSSPQQSVNYQLLYLYFILRRGVSMNIPWTIY